MEFKNLEERRERVADLSKSIAELDEKWANKPMDDEARTQWNDWNAEVIEEQKAIKELEARESRLRELSGVSGATETVSGAPAFVRSHGSEIYDVHAIRASASSDADYKVRLSDNARRAADKAKFADVGRQSQSETREHVERLIADADDNAGTLARRILTTGNAAYDRAFGKLLMSGAYALTSEEQRAMSVGTDSAGGFAVPFELDPTVLLTNNGSVNPIRRISRVEKVTSGKWEGLTSAGVTVSRSAEAAEAADNSFTLGNPEVTTNRVIAEVPFSVKLDTAWPRLRAEISTILADAKDREEDSFITGDGTGLNPGGIVGSLASGSEVASGATQGLDDIDSLEAALPARYEDRASFLAAKSTYIQIRALARTAGLPDPWTSMVDGKPDELYGYPAYKASAVPAWAASGAVRWMVLGDFSRFLIVDQLGMSVELRPHVLGANRRWTGERAINAIWFNNSKILDDNAFRVLEAAA